jgi:hypothetical protein
MSTKFWRKKNEEKKHLIENASKITNSENLDTLKKKWITLDNPKENSQKISIFSCKDCNTIFANKYNLEKHYKTLRHNEMIEKNKWDKYNFHCEFCKNGYTHNSGLSKHKKKCKNNPINIKEIIILPINTENKDTALVNNITNNNTIVINNKINVNVYLNEHCKDAINMSDFMKKITPSFQEIEESQRKGIVQSIADTFVDRLKKLKSIDRPIHCSDKKRNTLYIKDNDNWNKDKEHQNIHKIIDEISYKQFKTLQKWVEEMSKEFETEENSDKVIKVTKEITTELGDNTYKKIIGKISKNIIIGT